MKVTITEAAYADLSTIGRYILDHNPVKALSFVEELQQACLQLGEMPGAFAELQLPTLKGIRRRPHGNYLIFYRIGASTIEVLRILHGARDYENILSPEE